MYEPVGVSGSFGRATVLDATRHRREAQTGSSASGEILHTLLGIPEVFGFGNSEVYGVSGNPRGGRGLVRIDVCSGRYEELASLDSLFCNFPYCLELTARLFPSFATGCCSVFSRCHCLSLTLPGLSWGICLSIWTCCCWPSSLARASSGFVYEEENLPAVDELVTLGHAVEKNPLPQTGENVGWEAVEPVVGTDGLDSLMEAKGTVLLYFGLGDE